MIDYTSTCASAHTTQHKSVNFLTLFYGDDLSGIYSTTLAPEVVISGPLWSPQEEPFNGTHLNAC